MLEVVLGFALAGLIIAIVNKGHQASTDREKEDQEDVIILKIPRSHNKES